MAPGELRRPVRDHPADREHAPAQEGQGDRGVDVQSGQRSPGVDQRHHQGAGGDHGGGPGDGMPARVLVDHSCPGGHGHQQEGASELDDQADPQRPGAERVLLKADQVAALHLGGVLGILGVLVALGILGVLVALGMHVMLRLVLGRHPRTPPGWGAVLTSWPLRSALASSAEDDVVKDRGRRSRPRLRTPDQRRRGDADGRQRPREARPARTAWTGLDRPPRPRRRASRTPGTPSPTSGPSWPGSGPRWP